MKITIIQEYGDNCYVLNCAYCKGVGREHGTWDYENEPCKVCKGKAVVAVQVVNGNPPFVVCQTCNGKGRKHGTWDYENEPCAACKGVGGQPIIGNIRLLS